MIAGLTGLMLALASPSCGQIAGSDAVLANRNTRWLVLGEQHGTVETPQLLTDLACLAAEHHRPVIVALECPATDQGKIDAFLASNGDAAARAALLTMPSWGPGFHDGRSSVAMLAMLDRLRRMKQQGQIRAVVAFVPPTYGGSGAYNAAMASRLEAIAGPDTTLILTLVGNVHAMKSKVTFGDDSFLPAAALLPARRTVTIDVEGNGGTAWNCQDICASHPNGVVRSAPRGITALSAGTPSMGTFDATLELGVPTTASPPAVP